jgi:hypothetical protein
LEFNNPGHTYSLGNHQLTVTKDENEYVFQGT